MKGTTRSASSAGTRGDAGRLSRGACAAALLLLAAAPAAGQDPGSGPPPGGPVEPPPEEATWPPAVPGVRWENGPCRASLGTLSEIAVPDGWNFSGVEGTKVLMELMHNPVGGQEKGVVFPGNDRWFAVFTFDPIGYVKDDEKDELDADEILDAIREGNEAGNAEREKRGWSTMTLEGWQTPPHYDAATQNLEWGLLFRTAEGQVVNYDVRLLGRHGVMQVSLVAAPDAMAAALPEFRALLAKHEFTAGEKYSEYTTGDKVAAVGLSALVAGGTLAIAAKTGILKKFWKFLLLGVVAAVAGLKKLFGPKRTERPRRGLRTDDGASAG